MTFDPATLTLDAVFAAVARLEPVTLDELQTDLRVPWRSRTTLRNRVYDLIAEGRLIEDEGRPMRVAVNHLHS